jgi:hypothetical protein
VDEYISNELIKTTLDPFDLASDLDMHSLPDNLSLIVQQLTTKLSAIFNAGKRPVTNAISLLPLDHLPGNSLQDFFGGLNH